MKINCIKVMKVCFGMDLSWEMMDDEGAVMNGESSGTKLKVYSSVLPSQLMINRACRVEQYMFRFKQRRLHTELLMGPVSLFSLECWEAVVLQPLSPPLIQPGSFSWSSLLCEFCI